LERFIIFGDILLKRWSYEFLSAVVGFIFGVPGDKGLVIKALTVLFYLLEMIDNEQLVDERKNY
jgi:hypothetical protein